VVVAPKEYDFSTDDHLPHVRAFICDGSAGVNLALGTWHWGPYPILDYVDLVNVQGKGFANDNEVAYLERDLDVVVEVML
jgi:ureidoglycolate hydrolase